MWKKGDCFNLFLFVSLFCHAGLIYLAYHSHPVREERGEEIFLVNLMDPLSGIEKETKEGVGMNQNGINRTAQFLTQKRRMEATVSLDAPEPQYASYVTIVKRRIDNVWDYPELAQKARVDGSLALRFSILRTGIINQLKLLRSSGYTHLDDEALRAIEVSSPFPPLPEHLKLSQLNILATFEYRIDQE